MKKGTDAREVADQFFHHNNHTNLLLELYPDLRVAINAPSISYYSTLINSEVDKFDINKEFFGSYAHVYTIFPYKEIRVNCNICNELIRVNSTPDKIPFIVEHEVSFNKEFIWYGLVYEEQLKLNNFNSAVLTKIQLFLIEELQKKTTPTMKVDISYLNNSIKKLLPFT